MSEINWYESKSVQDTFGEALRPGGLELTKRALDYCQFGKDDKLLDIGSGTGKTIKYISDNYNINISGLDISESLVLQAKKINKDADIIISNADKTPYEEERFNGVFAECTLSLMNNLESTICEIYRIMKVKGYLIISDIYANNPEYLDRLKDYPANTCLKRPHDLGKLKQMLIEKGFSILLEERHDDLLKQLVVKIIFEYGSLDKFWNLTSCINSDSKSFSKILKKVKLGYFLMIVQKNEMD